MKKNLNKYALVSLIVTVSWYPWARKSRKEEAHTVNTVSIIYRRAEGLFIIKQKLILFITFWRRATKCEAPLLNICLPADLLALFFPPSTPLTQIPLHTDWIVQWADLVLSLEKLQKPFPSPSVIQIHPNLFWVDFVLRRAVFAPEYHKLRVQNLSIPMKKASSVKQHLHAETHQGHTLCSGDHCHWGVESCHWLLPLGTEGKQEQDHELSYGAQQKCPGSQASLNPSQFKIQGNTQCCWDSTLQQKIWTHRSFALYPEKQREWWGNGSKSYPQVEKFPHSLL